MRVTPSVKKERAFVQDFAGRCEVLEIDAANADNDWDFKRMISDDEIAKSVVSWN